MIKFYKYSGAGNTFVVLDGRKTDVSRFRKPALIRALCAQYETDGLMILDDSTVADFRMEYFNSDGSGGMMCGNGGRCIVAFADLVGVKTFHSTDYTFEAADGLHQAQILSHLGECKIVRLGMVPVQEVKSYPDGYFLNTGTRHFVKFVDDAENVDVPVEGRALRWEERFAPIGTNVNFVSRDADGALRVRTFEKGVEAETLACGTGITASAIAACFKDGRPDGSYHYDIQAREDRLAVEFTLKDGAFLDVFLIGPALNLGDLVE